jgi:hypothetical protein
MTSDGRIILLRRTSEPNFAAWVVREAHRNGWCGWSVRQSVAVVQGVHRQRDDGHSDAHGWPDWVFWRAGEPLLPVELKTVEGKEFFLAHASKDKDQKRLHASLAQTEPPTIVRLWGPQDEGLIRHTFQGAT